MFDRKFSSPCFFSLLMSLAVLCLWTAALAGCGGGSGSNSTPAVVGPVTLNAAAATLDGGDTLSLSATVKNDQNSAGVKWSMSGAGSISGETTNSVKYAAPAATASSQTATVTATSNADSTESASTTITIPAAPSIASLTTAQQAVTVGTAYSVTLTGAGGIPPYTWTLAAGSGSLPSCLSLTSAGVLSATSTPTGACVGAFSGIKFAITDSGTPTALTATSAAQTITVSYPPLTITTGTTLPSGNGGAAYSQTLAASGGSGTGYSWTVASGQSQLTTLNLTLGAQGALTGTPPTAGGSATFGVQVTDSASNVATATFSLTIGAGDTITTTTLPAVDVGQSYNQTLQASGGAGTGYTWSATNSTLSTYGLSLSASGVITGTVTSCTTGCTASFTANVKDSGNNTATKNLTIQIYPALSLPAPDPASLPSSAFTGYAYGPGTITATGGSGSYSWAVTGLSDNLAVTGGTTGSTLTIAGTPKDPASGNSPVVVDFDVTLTDAVTGASIEQNDYNVTVSYQTAPSLPPASSTVPGPATEGQSYTESITATGGVGPTYTWTLNGSTTVPASGSVALGSGAQASQFTIGNSGAGSSVSIAGNPTAAAGSGSVTFTLAVKDNTTGLSSGAVTYTIQISGIQIALYNIPQGMVGMPYSFGDLSITGGVTPYTVTLGNLPAGLTQPAGAWGIDGIPTSAGSTIVTMKVVDSSTTPQTQTTTFTVPVLAKTVAANNSELKGQYACELEQYFDNGVTGGAGSNLYRGGAVFALAADGSGAISGGEIDSNSPSSGYQNATTNGTLGGAYVVGADNRGYLLLTAGTGSGHTFAIAGGNIDNNVFTELALTEMDDAGNTPSSIHGSGHCYLQNTTGLSGLAISGGYVWAQTGEAGDGSLFNGEGYIDLGSGTLSGVSDLVSSGTYQGNVTMTGNSLTAADSYGRVTFNYGPSGQAINPYVVYLVNDAGGHAVVMSANPHDGTGNATFMMGEMRAQNTANLAAGYPLSGSMVLYTTGLDNSATGYKSQIGQLTGSTSSAAITGGSGFLSNDAGTLGLYTTSGTIAYTEDPTTGRTTISASGMNTSGDVFYVYDTGSAAVLFADIGNGGGSTPQNQLGWIEPQIVPGSGLWDAGDMAGNYLLRSAPNGDYNNDLDSGSLALDSSGNFTTMTEDTGGPAWADWGEFMCGSECAGGSGTFVPDAIFDATRGFGIFDVTITQNSQTVTLSYCVAISVDKATGSNTNGRAACIDASSASPQLTIIQQ